jgi:hypothetical protein
MRKRIELNRPTHAVVVSYLALFIALGGSAYAVSKLPKNSVGPKQLKKNSVTTKKLKKNAVTGAKVKNKSLTGSDINLAKLGTVPEASHAASADSIPPAEPTHLVGAPGEPGFEGGSKNYEVPDITLPLAGFYKDHEGFVHLEGIVIPGASKKLFTLPPGYRPTPGQIRQYQPLDETIVIVSGVNFENLSAGNVIGASAPGSEVISLEGVTFRAES